MTAKAMNMPTKPDVFAEIHALIELIERAKNAGDYYSANLFFVAALHIITRNKRDLSAQTFQTFFFVEVDAGLESMFYDADSGEVGYYDLLNIRSFDARTCIPMPMLHMSITVPACQHAEKVERGDHDRDITPTLPDEWSEAAYGYLRMGEEAAPLYLSESGMAEVEYLRGRRVGTYRDEDGVVIDAEVETM
jgi:hypothetical protein